MCSIVWLSVIGGYVSQADILSAVCVSRGEGSNVAIGGTVVNGTIAISFQQKPNQGRWSLDDSF
jgi:hypothetical protein